MTYEAAQSTCPGAMWINDAASAAGSARSTPGARVTPRERGPQKDKRHDRLEYRVIFAAAFLVFFITSAVERALPVRWASRTSEMPKKSLIQQAREAAGISATYAFMG